MKTTKQKLQEHAQSKYRELHNYSRCNQDCGKNSKRIL